MATKSKSFQAAIQKARADRGLSGIQVAERVGVSAASVYFWETGYCRPRDHNLAALCKVLKLPVREMRELE